MIPEISLTVIGLPVLIQPYARIIRVLQFEDTPYVKADILPIIKNCDRFREAAANPDSTRAIIESEEIFDTSGAVSKMGTRHANMSTAIGA